MIIEIDSPVWQSTSIEMGEAQIRRLLPALEDVAAKDGCRQLSPRTHAQLKAKGPTILVGRTFSLAWKGSLLS